MFQQNSEGEPWRDVLLLETAALVVAEYWARCPDLAAAMGPSYGSHSGHPPVASSLPAAFDKSLNHDNHVLVELVGILAASVLAEFW